MRQTDARSIMDSGLDGVELAVALALWSFADDAGRCWPALRSLCRRSGWRERAVQRSLRNLEAAGVLSVHHVPTRVTPTYVLHIGALPANAEAQEPEAEGGCLLDTPGVSHAPPVSVVHPPVSNRHPPVSVVHPNPPENPSENPPENPPSKEHMSASPPPAVAGQPSLFGQAQEPVKRKPTAADRATAEAVRTFEALEALRLTRHAGGRGLSAAVWVPRVKAAIAKSSAQDLLDAMVWTLHDPAAAFHRGEDPRSPGPDRTVDLSLILRHPEYALRRSWVGAQGPTAEELAALHATQEAGAEPPAWVERRDASPSGRRERVERERIEREEAEAKAQREATPARRTWLAPWEEGYVSAFDT